MTDSRENWTSRSGFIIAAIGSAVGLGNIWRFPYVAYENGGGAFLIPYLIALITAGLPLLFLDYAVGHRSSGSPPKAYRKLFRGGETLGWWQVSVCIIIGLYYASVLTWAGSYVYFSIGQMWGSDPEGFFFKTYLQTSEATGFDPRFVSHIFWPLAGIWVLTLIILYGGVKKGVELSNKIFMPLLFVLFTLLVIQSLRLPGAVEGLNAFFTPNWAAMMDYKVWLAAYGHTFFSLSVGFGIMVTYASYLKPKTNLTGSGLIVGFANASTEILAGIGIFSALGFMAYSSNSNVQDVVSGGIGLAFIAFPKIISSLGAGADLFGILFFTSLFVAGISSMVSILEVPISAMMDKLKWGRKKAVTIVGGGSALVSIVLFSSVNSIKLVDIIDHFINNIGIIGGALISIISIAWFKRSALLEIRNHVNAISTVHLGKGWDFTLTVITSLILLITLAMTIYNLLLKGYGDYSISMQWLFGWGCVIFCAVVAFVLARMKDR
ncbi:sodium-dependent transporter [Acinetobacter haemolyticus]|jgi:NSS family neurotransmitter:Na+ symporter|uniref:Transporter n=1 Tax=Acinetobacter sp. A1-4-2 TaxID=3156489 RepID=A0AAU7SXC3_9GAMM|nr:MULTISPECIES: sodium-dependent transporter [unclassified Acinetobacter]MDD2947072.1 sodium-dependent transporter [Acinetobacter sp.]OTG68025.1 sodium-dependent transporter [Acinetobacter sp. ANC 4218]QQN39427.1 sodium-dependent transporter [Acinetobacter sp. CS-2]UDM38261.1 sodium-dependent transporter [Acinetobacter haemolyticus]